MVSRSPAASTDETKPLNKEPTSGNTTTLSPAHHLAPYPKLSDLPPVGQSVWPLIWERDPASPTKKKCYMALTVACLAYLLQPSVILYVVPWLNVNWDIEHGITDLGVLMEFVTGLSSQTIHTISWITCVSFGALIVADAALGVNASKKQQTDLYPWPTAWKTDNYLCYHDMFSEPTRHGRLLRRPGNTLSNFMYFFTCLTVLSTCLFSDKPNPYLWSDLQFAFMLLVLTVTSVLWHASNAPFVQYPDLWSMFSCIGYLVVRYICQAVITILNRYAGSTVENATWWAATLCCVVYSGILVGLGSFYYGQFQKGWLHGTSPDSVRARLTGNSDIFGQGHEDIYVGVVCVFTAIPFIAMALPTAIMIGLYGSAGSRIGATLAFRTLMVGWTYRTWERFLLDGHPLMNYFIAKPAGLVKTVGCALVSPTAQHHAWTGVTLLVGYLHGRSLEDLSTDS